MPAAWRNSRVKRAFIFLARNAEMFRGVIGEVLRTSPGVILLVASSRLDIMTQGAQTLSRLPLARVIGSGAILEPARFRSLPGQHLGIAPGSVHAYVLGENDDSEGLAWSAARAGSVALTDFAVQVSARLTEAVRARIDTGVRHTGYTIT